MMLGPCSGGAVRFGPNSECIMIAEGIETAPSATQATGKQEPTPEPRRKRKPARATAVEPTLTA
jgi:hypothetical protein